MITMYLDLETYSDVPITHGTHAYAEGAEIMVAAWAFGDDPVHVDDFTVRETFDDLSLEFSDALLAADRVVIHNSQFDRTILRRAWGIDLPLEQIEDTLVTARAHSLPGSLAKLCDILKVPTDRAKDKDGKRLINLFCKPRPKNQKLRRATRETHPQEWAAFLDYARLDVDAMREVHKRLPRWNLTPGERALWFLDQRINDRGVAIDLELATAAVEAVAKDKAALADETIRLTDGAVASTTQGKVLLDYLEDTYGLRPVDLKASTLERLLEDDTLDPGMRELILVRLRAATASVAKYNALLRATSPDDRLRGSLEFCGAARTGRWAGRLFQPQNLPRPAIDNEAIDAGIAALKSGCADLTHADVMELASAAVRGAIIAPPGRKLVVCDLANIEGRVLAWLAGEQWKLDAFAQGIDLYYSTASKILGKAKDDISKSERNAFGKVPELALGYEGGVGAFLTFAGVYSIDVDDMALKARPQLSASVLAEAAGAWDWARKQRRTYGLKQDTWVVLDAIKRAWRAAHPAIARLWGDYVHAAKVVIQSPGGEFAAGRVVFRREKAWLLAQLPSGRCLCYPGARIEDGGGLSYMGVNQYTRRFERISTYGGKLAENITQAVARDVLAHGMTGAEEAGFDVVLSVHDELITENPEDFTWQSLAAIMSTPPAWADGLPLAAAGFEAMRYRKD